MAVRRNPSQGQIRIIGGDFRGRKLPVRSAEGLRPTSDRMRETLFNWLQFDIAGMTCLDVFAGTGALGLEALSRGASRVDFLELDADNVKQLQQNIQTLNINHATLTQTDSLQWLQQACTQPYDLIFLDPPFGKGLMQPVLDTIFQQKWIQNNQAWLYLEQEKSLNWPLLPSNWQLYREKTTSQVKMSLWHSSGNPV
ncbi:16S rRNA (guanine(966)-N(2))-methyltransferase RsmD [Hydrogenovibrio sp. SC-1]|uniref:16S rRNA (guanine(966)-N(2))-methyltransferase RsmD n=1 Tax=Hydrogenovibrio sp. SC-1 TaxID=2065820 RepID=UPI000C7BE1B9|nr:16S rRNA (guanine(966)-N(2))-methyltransferase RsmD [Hydrogenovibrio sp. SC-1]PLA74231.1 16S rRNA (guanine(966)-N(2))-methyltransferase RsmD [Hydrogenovibrio sp. SC-1]